MPRTVLVVDDSAAIRKILQRVRQMVTFTLKQAGFTVMEAADGKDALQRLGTGRVDLVVTDLNMPNMDGITLIRSLRARPASKTTPVLMLTTESQESKRMEGRAAGASGWIVKPFQPDKLLQVIGKVLP